VSDALTSIKMFSTTNGWGTISKPLGPNDTRVVYTSDGGSTWVDITPADANDLSKDSLARLCLYARSMSEAWIWFNYHSVSIKNTALWHTFDGGVSWQVSTVPTMAVSQLYFIDNKNGWLVASPTQTDQSQISVWRTTDGGANWSSLSAKMPGTMGLTTGITFTDATTGYLSANTTSSTSTIHGFIVTHDAGKTWTDVLLPQLASNVEITPPIFTGSTNGILFVKGSNKLFTYRTTDAGTTWAIGPDLSSFYAVSPSYLPVTGVNSAGNTFAAVGIHDGNNFKTMLYKLPLNTANWKHVNVSSASIPLIENMRQLDFIDESIGWVIIDGYGLLHTIDGGVTWYILRSLNI
jgi:photosystem II stability/assembly factor-like uncharacterized protein